MPRKNFTPCLITYFFILLCLPILPGGLFVFPQGDQENVNSRKPTLLTFQTTRGTISITLPSVLYPGDVVSGSIEGKAAGNTEEQLSENKNLLNSYSVTVLEKSFSVEEGKLTAEISESESISIEIHDEDGALIEKTSIPVPAEPDMDHLSTDEFAILPYVAAGTPARIEGSFDGYFSSSALVCNGQNLKLLAESNREIIFEAPTALTGPQTINLRENKQNTSLKTNVLGLKLSADKLDLMKGEQTVIHIEVSGLEGLETPVPMSITNTSPSTVSLEGGNQQNILIHPATDSPSGIFQRDLKIRAMVRGGFTLTVSIDPPQDDSLPVGSQPLCDCRINGKSNLLNPEACRQLGGHIYGTEEETEDIQEEVPIEEKETFIRLRETQSPAEDGIWHLSLISSDDLAGIRYSYKNVLDSEWTPLRPAGEAAILQWSSANLPAGFYVIRARAANQTDSLSETYFYAEILGTSENIQTDVVYTVSADDIERARRRARQAGDRIREKEDELGSLHDKKQEAEEERDRNSGLADQLEEIDATLERIPGTYKQKIEDVLDKMRQIRDQLPDTTDTTLLNQAVADAERRLKDCHDRLENLKKEQSELENQRDELKKQQDELLERIDQIFRDAGWTGGYGYHSDGRFWFGYVGDENADTSIRDEVYKIRKELRSLRGPYVDALRRLGEIPNDIKAAEDECARLNDELQKAKEAAKNGEELAALQVSLNDLCRQIRSLLRPILQWCRNNPDECDFEDEIIRLMEDCPTDSDSWEKFWKNFDRLISEKQNEESQLHEEAEDQQAEADNLQDKIDQTKDEIDKLREQEQAEYERAEKLRRQRAEEQAAARKAREEQERRRRERDRVKPQPYLDEPVDPSDDQLKFQAQIALRGLITDYLISERCSCKTKALILAHGTNTIVSDIIGRIGVGVAFAPLEAFPGVRLGGRIAIGALKAIASSIYGGEDLSDELIKNLFDAVGGELFPKLVGDEFTGNRINSLAGRGLDEILEAEGIRTVQWEGTYNSRQCGELSGKTTLFVNPNTGWVVMMIKIPSCPLVVVKYKINDDGVAITNPTVEEIK